jgi:hypothetical protein
MKDEAKKKPHQKQARGQPIDPEWHVARVATGHPCRMLAGDLDSDFGP